LNIFHDKSFPMSYYFIYSPLQSKTNQRTDDYGGSIEKKYRMLKEVVAAVCTVFPPSRVGVRLAPNGSFNDMGHADNHETFCYVVSQLEHFKLGYLHCIDGLAFGFHDLCKQFTLYDCRKVGYTGVIMGSTGYTKDLANGAIGTGVCDMIAFGRPFMSNPDLVERLRNDWPLAELAEYKAWWTPPYENCAVGYTDYPCYVPPAKFEGAEDDDE
jgi:N-ethylmaleimide reductase